MSQLKVNSIVDAAGGSSAVLYGVASPPNSMGFRNRIINGEMRIDQRNNGASVTPVGAAATYTLDRWGGYNTQGSKFSVQRNAGSVTPPAGFTNYLGVTSLSAYSPISTDQFQTTQAIEGFNVADLGWGTASAQSVTLSFWVRSSLTGTFAVSFVNKTNNRSYPATYTISASNTWEFKTITVAGDTTGTWTSDNSTGLGVRFVLGYGASFSGTANSWNTGNLLGAAGVVQVVGTSGATFYITGVQLEAGTVATPFERRDYGRELMMAQRYYQTVSEVAGNGAGASSANSLITAQFVVPMRATPTISSTNYLGSVSAPYPSPDVVTFSMTSNVSNQISVGNIKASAEL